MFTNFTSQYYKRFWISLDKVRIFSFLSLQFCFRIDSVLSFEFGVPETDHKPDRSWEGGWERIDHKVLCAIGNS